MWLDVNTKKTVTASSAKAIGDDYASFTSCFGWQVKGIWKPFSDYTDVNSVCRTQSRNFLASADDFGQVNIYKYPVLVEKAIHSSYLGHSSHVTKVKFSAGDRYLVSTGGHDKTVLIWENYYGVNPNDFKADGSVVEEDDAYFMEEEVKGDQAFGPGMMQKAGGGGGIDFELD
jgi:WD40 repeat protein